MVAASGKFQLLDKMLIKLKETGHRVLIFSQMTKMLDILEDYLHFKKFDYERLDGSIPADVRQERIDRFNMPNSNVFCFLLSTRAGGLGINLATADTVVIFDSDWNPHNDLQALSRCHRIGQDKKVMIYRFVTRNSVEEKILQRSKEKLMLEQLVVRKISSGKAEGSLLSQSELDEILRHGAADIFKTDDKDNKDSLTPSSGGIYYDDDAIIKLLDRSQITDADTLENEVNNEYLQGFKVAEFGSSVPKVDKMEVDAGEDAKEKIDERDQDYWDKLLKDRFEEYEAEEEQGKENAKRTRHARHKMQRGLSEEYWEISKKLVGKKKKGDSSSDSESSSSSSEEAEEQDESYEDDGQTLVDDFDLEMQDAVIDIPGMVRRPMTVPPPGMAPHEMMPGSPTKASSNRPPASSMSTFTINPTSHAAPTTLTTASATAIKTAINNKKVSSPALMEGSDKGLKVLGFNAAQRKSFITMLMAFGVGDGSWGHFLSSPAKPKSLAGKSHRDLASYGSLLLMHLLEKPNDTDKFSDSVPKEGIKQSEVLQRIALLFLVRNKVLEILGGKDFDINDGRVTNLFKSWGNAAMPWKKEHDRTLLFGVMKHGYSRWVDIALDEDLKLTKVIHDQLAYEDKVASRNPSASKKEHKEGEQNGTANNNDQSDGKDNSEKEKDSEKGDKEKEKDKEKDKDKPFSDVRTKKFVKRRMGLIEQALIVENQLRELQAQQQQSKSSTSPISVSNMGSIAPQTSAEATPRVSPLTSNVNYASSYTFNNTNFNGAKSSSVVSIQPASSMTSITSATLPSVSTLLNSEKKSLLEIKPSTTPTSISPKPIVPISNLTAPVTSTAAPAGTTTVVPPLDTNMAFIQKFRELYAYVKGPEFMGATDITTLNELVVQTKKYLNEL
jgi:superfamily II DNA/RNA helicase